MDVIHSSVVTLMLFLTSSELVTGEVYYIKSSQNVSCSVAADQPCLTSQFAVSTSNHQNITLIILPGNHSLLSSFHLRNLSSFSMLSESYAGTIMCEWSTSVYLQSISQVHIKNLKLYWMWRQWVSLSGSSLNPEYQVWGTGIEEVSIKIESVCRKNCQLFFHF